jgi:ABC-type lipoprotein export system ATPase subunit
VFDEATSALDSLTEQEIGRTMREISASSDVITVVICHPERRKLISPGLTLCRRFAAGLREPG